MCGIAGYYAPRRRGGPAARAVIERMTECLAHRGPDDAGYFEDEGADVALGHRRLSIVELSPEGHQPMHSAAARYVIVFNGEIYNYRELARELAGLGARFRGHSDTEVMLHAIERWGLEVAVRRFVGIFAFALWDRRDRTLALVRDHLGVKPLYYGWVGETLVFGSELKALVRFPGFDASIDRSALTLLLRHNCVPAPYTIYHGVRKLVPGTIVLIGPGDAPGAERGSTYWSARAVALAGLASPLACDADDARDALERTLSEAIGLQMVADVPVGAFLSGGVDSSVVVALMQAQSARPVRTFTIGFAERGYDEAADARRVAQHLGTDHTELRVSADAARDVIPMLPSMYDEPFADSSQIPTFLVSRLARQSVTVALSGDGGDELFAGYNRHVWGPRLARRLRGVPAPVRRAIGRALAAVPAERWDRYARATPRLTALGVGRENVGQKIHKLAEVVGADQPAALYRALTSHWKRPTDVVLGSAEPATLLTRESEWLARGDFTEQMLYLDLVTYLPDDVLVKVDRASMAVGLEARVPLLDHRVVEFAWRLPLELKLRNGVGKHVLREVLYRHVPRELVDRPKAGFGIPLAAWLRGPLRGWAEDLLAADRLRREGFFDVDAVRRRWSEHLGGTREWEHHLWDVLMFQAWLESRA